MRIFIQKYCLFIFVSLIFSCSSKKQKTIIDYEIATSWADMTLFVTKNTPANSPTYSSRCLGYIGLTMYESVVNSSSNYQSLEGQLNGLDSLPKPEKGKIYDWKIVANAGQATILKNIYNQTSDVNKAKIDSLEVYILTRITENSKDSVIIKRSVSYGKAVALRIFEWSKTDGGHRGYLKNFDKSMKYPSFSGCWKPPLFAQSFSHYPLHPHWGENRTFLVKNSEIEKPKFIKPDTTKSSEYYQQFVQVYEKKKVLTQNEKEAAIWWSDDPDETFTPPGHSYYLATLAIHKTQPSLIKCAETYARVGMAVADAFRNCWKWKYQFFSERPNTFVTQHIEQNWESFWPDPPFPAFPSGHAIQAAAMAMVLSDLYGKNFAFTDSAHVGRKRDEMRNTDFKARHFNSFWEVATETANSRFLGGIHCPQDNERGLEKGKEIADNINALKWKK
jgi:hypothetical protein